MKERIFPEVAVQQRLALALMVLFGGTSENGRWSTLRMGCSTELPVRAWCLSTGSRL
jgi:hypothetical protein